MSDINTKGQDTTDEAQRPVDVLVSPRVSFLKELQELVNKHSKENDSDTPDFILAQYLNNCLTNFNLAQQQRSDWYSG